MLYPHEIVDPLTKRVQVAGCGRTAARAGQCGCGGGCGTPCPCTDPSCIVYQLVEGELSILEVQGAPPVNVNTLRSVGCCAPRPQPGWAVPIHAVARGRLRMSWPAGGPPGCPFIRNIDSAGEGTYTPGGGVGIEIVISEFVQSFVQGQGCVGDYRSRSINWEVAHGCGTGDVDPGVQVLPPQGLGWLSNYYRWRYGRGTREFLWLGTRADGLSVAATSWMGFSHLPWCTAGVQDPGACCCGGVCRDCQGQAECLAMRGVWLGAGTRCSDELCRIRGRCCIPRVGCAELTKEDCAAAAGRWSPGSCVPGGIGGGGGGVCPWACCLPQGGCVETASAAECAGLGGLWRELESCSSVVCPGTGACCYRQLGFWFCNQLSEAACGALPESTWHFGEPCGGGICPACNHSACCYTVCGSHGNCERICVTDMDPGACAGAGQNPVYTPGVVCGEPTAECPGLICVSGREGGGRQRIVVPRRGVRAATLAEVARDGRGGGGGAVVSIGGGGGGGGGCAGCGGGIGF